MTAILILADVTEANTPTQHYTVGLVATVTNNRCLRTASVAASAAAAAAAAISKRINHRTGQPRQISAERMLLLKQ